MRGDRTLAQTLRTGNPLVIANNEELCEHPGLVRVKSEDHACATMPVFDTEGQLIGALNIAFDEPRVFQQEELDAIEALARHCGEAMVAAQRAEGDVNVRMAARTPARAGRERVSDG